MGFVLAICIGIGFSAVGIIGWLRGRTIVMRGEPVGLRIIDVKIGKGADVPSTYRPIYEITSGPKIGWQTLGLTSRHFRPKVSSVEIEGVFDPPTNAVMSLSDYHSRNLRAILLNIMAVTVICAALYLRTGP